MALMIVPMERTHKHMRVDQHGRPCCAPRAAGLFFPRAEVHPPGVSKAFTREDDAAGPQIEAPAPHLAPGEVRYVTPEGFRTLQRELELLDPASRRAKALAATLPLLTVHAPRCEGRAVFGCWVVLRDESGEETSWRIVGPDEADAKERRLSVASPRARELLGKEAGDFVSIELPRGTAEFEVVAVRATDPD